MTLGFYPLVIVVNLWGRLFAFQTILFFTDNEALDSVINKQRSKDPVVVVEMVFYISLQRLHHDILFWA